MAALVVFFGLGLPLCCYFKRGWCACALLKSTSAVALTTCLSPLRSALYELRATRARNARLAAAAAEFDKVGTASEWTQAKTQAQAAVPQQYPQPPAFFGRAAPAAAAYQNPV